MDAVEKAIASHPEKQCGVRQLDKARSITRTCRCFCPLGNYPEDIRLLQFGAAHSLYRKVFAAETAENRRRRIGFLPERPTPPVPYPTVAISETTGRSGLGTLLMTQFLSPRDIILDQRAQPRDHINPHVVERYVEAMRDGDEFPPVVVFHDGEKYYCADGFHRTYAARTLKLEEIEADVRKGTIRDAILHSVGANASHGYARSNEDKRRAVITLLKDQEWNGWSDAEIARRANVSQRYVSGLRPGFTQNVLSERTYTTKHGTVSTMKTGNIGAKPKAAPEGTGGVPDTGNPSSIPAPIAFDRPEKSEEQRIFEVNAEMQRGKPAAHIASVTPYLVKGIGAKWRDILAIGRTLEGDNFEKDFRRVVKYFVALEGELA